MCPKSRQLDLEKINAAVAGYNAANDAFNKANSVFQKSAVSRDILGA